MVEHSLSAIEAGKLLKSDPLSMSKISADKWWRDNARELLDLFAKPHSRVVIKGRTFNVKYLEGERIKLDPVEGFVPCGVVSASWLKSVVK
jgi:hypothetical protein